MPEEAATYLVMTPEEAQLHRHTREADSRVAQAAKERELGTSYLRVGNLKQVHYETQCCSGVITPQRDLRRARQFGSSLAWPEIQG
jgi:hypothetical protein